MRVVHRTDPVVRTTQLKQLLVNPVDDLICQFVADWLLVLTTFFRSKEILDQAL